MAFEWVVKLYDSFSDPATRVERSIRRMTASLRDLQAQQKEYAAQQAYSTNNQGRGDLLMKQAELLLLRNKRDALKSTGGALDAFTDKMKEARRWTRDWLLILSPIVQLTRFVTSGIASMGKSIGESIAVRQDARIGFQTAFGDHSEQMLQMTQDLATRTGRPVKELFHEAMNFGNLGAPKEQIRPMLLAISDAKVMGLEYEKLNRVFEASLSKPIGTLREISEGLRGVVDETKLWAHLAEDVGIAMGRKINIGEVGELYKQHRIGGGFVRQAVMETLQDREQGKLGLTQFKRADNTLGGTIDRFEARLDNIFANVEKTKGFKTFKSALDNILSVLTEKRTQKLVDSISNGLGRIVEPLTGPEGKKRMENFFERMGELVQKVLPGVTLLADGIDKLTRRWAPSKKDLEEEAISPTEKNLKEGISPKTNRSSRINEYFHDKFPSFFGIDKDPISRLPNSPATPEAFMIGNRQVSKEEYFGLPGGNKKSLDLQKEREDEREKDRAAIISVLKDLPGNAWRMLSSPIHITQQIDARGASEKDTQAVAKAAKDATIEGLADAFDRMNTETP